MNPTQPTDVFKGKQGEIHTMQIAELELLVLDAQNGDQRAFEQLYIHHNKHLLRYAYRLSGDKEMAMDAVQEAWISFAKKIRSIHDPRASRAWLYKLVRWRVTDLARIKAKSNKMEHLDENLDHIPADVAEVDGSLSAAIIKLPAIERQAIHLFYLDELKVSEISIILDIPQGTVKSRLNRARGLLKQKLSQSNERGM